MAMIVIMVYKWFILITLGQEGVWLGFSSGKRKYSSFIGASNGDN
jgi:hypothetical protein